MRAMVYKKYGSEQVLKLENIKPPVPKANEVLIKLHATSLNASDMEYLQGKPAYTRFLGLFKPRKLVLGSDIAGVVTAIGNKVTQFKVGDAVFGDIFELFGGLAEYVCAPQQNIVLKPQNLSFTQAAAIPQAALVALQSLQKGGIEDHKDLKILINGGGGGSGSFAIQLAKMFGAHITAVDAADKQDFMRQLGADYTLDYKQHDFAANGQAYDLILDLVATRKAAKIKPALAKGGKYIMAGGNIPTIFSIVIMGYFSTIFSTKKIGLMAHRRNQADLKYMLELFNSGEALPIIDQTYPLDQSAKAFAKLISGKAKGKLVVIICPEPQS